MLFDKTYQEVIVSHYEKIFGSQAEFYLMEQGPIQKLPYDFRVLEFAPSAGRNMWTYATCCMSQQEDNSLIELHLVSSKRDTSIVELLTAATYYHRQTAKLGLHHTVNFGRPWQDESECTYGYISLPYLDGPSLEN